MVNAWTRDDLFPRREIVALSRETHERGLSTKGFADAVLDRLVEHLNAHHPKPDADALLYRAEQAERERDAAVARAEAAERELNPPVFDVDVERAIRAEFADEGFHLKTPVEYRVIRAVCELFGVKAEPTVDPAEDVALIISAGMFHKEPSPELVREIAQEVVDYFKEEFDGA